MTVLPELLPLSIKMVCLSMHIFLLPVLLPAADMRCCRCPRMHAVGEASYSVTPRLTCATFAQNWNENAQAERKLTGIMNYTNPGAVSHNEILQMYKDYIDPEFTWKNFTVEEQAKVIVAPRSNNLLDTKRVRCRPAGMLALGSCIACAPSADAAQWYAVVRRRRSVTTAVWLADRGRVPRAAGHQGVAHQVRVRAQRSKEGRGAERTATKRCAAGQCMLEGMICTCTMSLDTCLQHSMTSKSPGGVLAGGQGSEGDARPLKQALDSPQDVPGLLPGHWQSVRFAESGSVGVSTRAQYQQLRYGRKRTAEKCSWLSSDGCCTMPEMRMSA